MQDLLSNHFASFNIYKKKGAKYSVFWSSFFLQQQQMMIIRLTEIWKLWINIQSWPYYGLC